MIPPRSVLSDFGSTPDEQRRTLNSCLSNLRGRRDNVVDYYNEVGWNHGSTPVTRPISEEQDIAHFESLLEELT